MGGRFSPPSKHRQDPGGAAVHPSLPLLTGLARPDSTDAVATVLCRARAHLRPPFAAAPSISTAIKNPLSQQFLLGQGNHSPAVPPKLASRRPLAPHTTMCAPLVTGGGPVGHYSAVRLSSRPHESIQSGALPAALSPPAALWKGALRTYSSQSTVFWNMVSFYSAPAVLSRGKIVLFGARRSVGRNGQALPPGAPGCTAGVWGSTSGCAGQALRQSHPIRVGRPVYGSLPLPLPPKLRRTGAAAAKGKKRSPALHCAGSGEKLPRAPQGPARAGLQLDGAGKVFSTKRLSTVGRWDEAAKRKTTLRPPRRIGTAPLPPRPDPMRPEGTYKRRCGGVDFPVRCWIYEGCGTVSSFPGMLTPSDTQ